MCLTGFGCLPNSGPAKLYDRMPLPLNVRELNSRALVNLTNA